MFLLILFDILFFPIVVPYLRGIDTSFSKTKSPALLEVVPYLRGIDTRSHTSSTVLALIRISVVPYLRGIDTL